MKSCTICGKVLLNYVDACDHYRGSHGRNVLMCPYCELYFLQASLLTKHVLGEHSNEQVGHLAVSIFWKQILFLVQISWYIFTTQKVHGNTKKNAATSNIEQTNHNDDEMIDTNSEPIVQENTDFRRRVGLKTFSNGNVTSEAPLRDGNINTENQPDDQPLDLTVQKFIPLDLSTCNRNQ